MEEEQDALKNKKLVSQIKKEQLKMEAEAERAIQAIKDLKDAETIKASADAEAYKLRTIAAAEKETYTRIFRIRIYSKRCCKSRSILWNRSS